MTYRHLLAAIALIGAATSISAQSVKSGIDAWQRADYAGAVAIWRPLAEHGDADAQFNLGQAYRLGRGVATNLAAAKTWFERASRQDHVDAQTTLGLLLFQNGDRKTGLSWLKQAAGKGEPRAQLVYGTALVNGDGVTQDSTLGYAFVSRAAAAGLQPAKDTLNQLDEVVPIADRKRGTQIAADLAKSAPAAPASPGTVSRTVQTATAKKVVKRPPSPASAPTATVATATPAKPALVKLAPATGAWRIQLGAFSQRGSAQALYAKLAGKPALAGRGPVYIPVGPMTRLQAGPFESKPAADAACRALGVPCFAVPAR